MLKKKKSITCFIPFKSKFASKHAVHFETLRPYDASPLKANTYMVNIDSPVITTIIIITVSLIPLKIENALYFLAVTVQRAFTFSVSSVIWYLGVDLGPLY